MDTFQKIYKALVIMLILSVGVLCLNDLGVMDLSPKMTSEGADTTGFIVLAIAIVVLIMSFIFSRAANVIANKNNRVVGYIAVFISLIVLLLLAIVLIMGTEAIIKYISYVVILFKVVILVALMVLVFEVPQANTRHGLFQKITAGIIAITFIFTFFINDNNKIDLSTIEIGNTDSSMEEIGEEEKKNTTNDKIQTVLTYLSLGCFLLNPMLRVYYLDQDYSEEKEIENIIKDASEKVNDDKNNANKQISIPKRVKEVPRPVVTVEPVEEIHEKVVNPNYKPVDLPDAIIPIINSDEVSSTQEKSTNEFIETNSDNNQSATPLDQVQQPVVQMQPDNALGQQEFVQSNIDNNQIATPLDQVQQPVVQMQPDNALGQQEFVQSNIDNSQIATPLDQVQQPVVQTQPDNALGQQEFVQSNIDNSQIATPLDQVQQPVVQTQPDNALGQQEFVQSNVDNSQIATPLDQVQQPVDIQPAPMINLEQLVQNEGVNAENNQNINVQSATSSDQTQQPPIN